MNCTYLDFLLPVFNFFFNNVTPDHLHMVKNSVLDQKFSFCRYTCFYEKYRFTRNDSFDSVTPLTFA